MIAPMNIKDRLFGEKGYRKYGEAIGEMRDVRDNLDLAQLQAAGEGFILNIRDDRIKLHLAGCEAVGPMSHSAYPKVFFKSVESLQWIKVNLGDTWAPCGTCRPPDF